MSCITGPRHHGLNRLAEQQPGAWKKEKNDIAVTEGPHKSHILKTETGHFHSRGIRLSVRRSNLSSWLWQAHPGRCEVEIGAACALSSNVAALLRGWALGFHESEISFALAGGNGSYLSFLSTRM